MNPINIRSVLDNAVAKVSTHTKLSLATISQFFTGNNVSPFVRYNWSEVAKWFEGYEDPFTEFRVVINGVEQRFSVSELCIFSRSQASEAERAIDAKLSQLINEGILSLRFEEPSFTNEQLANYRYQNGNNYLSGYDERWRDPKRFFNFPSQFDFYFAHPEMVPRPMPLPKMPVANLYLGRNFFNVAAYSSSRLLSDIIELCGWIDRKHAASNCDSLFSPMIQFGFSMHDNSRLFNALDDNAMNSFNQVFRLDNRQAARVPNLSGRSLRRYYWQGLYGIFNQSALEAGASLYHFPIQAIYARSVEPPGLSRLRFDNRVINRDFVVNRDIPSVVMSLDLRNRVYAKAPNDYRCYLSDVGSEFLQVVNLSNAVSQIPCHVLLHGNMQYYNECLGLAYSTTQLSTPAAIRSYAMNVDRENAVRRAMVEDAPLNALGYAALAGLDIFAAKTMGTAMLAASNGQNNSSNNYRPFASVIKAFEAISVLLDPPQQIERVDQTILRDGVPPVVYENNWYPYLMPQLVCDNRPFKRIN